MAPRESRFPFKPVYQLSTVLGVLGLAVSVVLFIMFPRKPSDGPMTDWVIGLVLAVLGFAIVYYVAAKLILRRATRTFMYALDRFALGHPEGLTFGVNRTRTLELALLSLGSPDTHGHPLWIGYLTPDQLSFWRPERTRIVRFAKFERSSILDIVLDDASGDPRSPRPFFAATVGTASGIVELPILSRRIHRYNSKEDLAEYRRAIELLGRNPWRAIRHERSPAGRGRRAATREPVSRHRAERLAVWWALPGSNR